jgi:hypothetical protein
VLLGACPLVDGTTWFAAALRPHPDPLWEAAFTGFEATVYRPAADRVPLRAGTFRWVGAAGSGGTALDAIAERVARFEATL